MQSAFVGASGRHATPPLGFSSLHQCPKSQVAQSSTGKRMVVKRCPSKRQVAVGALPDGDVSRAIVEAWGALGGLHIADVISQASNALQSGTTIADANLVSDIASAPDALANATSSAADLVNLAAHGSSLGPTDIPVNAGLNVADSSANVISSVNSITVEPATANFDLMRASVSPTTVAADAVSDAAGSLVTAAVESTGINRAAEPLASTGADVAASIPPAAAEAAKSNRDGWFQFLADIFETALRVIDGGLESLDVPYSYGFSIVLLTLGVKVLTFPLSKQQVESSIAMQQLQPRVKEIQEKYKNNPERLQQETALLYQESGVNPLAGCLPTLATIPVFIGLYRSLTQAAEDGILNEGWFFIPSLAGPTTIGADGQGGGTSWLFPFVDGAPPVGWHDAGAYLVLPVLLVISQIVSQKIISPPKSDDPSQQQVQAFLSFLPYMLGWFSLNVPSGLTLYWITNNILSTGQQVFLKSTTKPPELKPFGTVVKPKEAPSQRVTGAQMGSRRSKVIDVEAVNVVPDNVEDVPGAKFRARKAKQAAKKAAEAVSKSDEGFSKPPPELAFEITPLTENLEKPFAEGEDMKTEVQVAVSEESSSAAANVVVKSASEVAQLESAPVAAVAGKSGFGGGKRKGRKGKKGRKKK